MPDSRPRRPVAAAWEGYREACYPNGLSEQQETECRQAFFSAAAMFLHLLTDLSNDNEAAAMEMLNDINEEMREYGEDLDRRLGVLN